jgi:phosphocarrier protein
MTETNEGMDSEQGDFLSRIRIVHDEHEVDAKSILEVLTLAAGPGDVLEIRATGDDAVQAVEALERLFHKRFDE